MAGTGHIGSLTSVIKAALVAGLLAGAITAGMHALVLEPLIERAIELEERAHQASAKPEEAPVIDRPTQRWGMVLGFLIYGAIWGSLFGILAYGGQSLRPGRWTTTRYGFFLALLMGWSVALLPFLKYPANPPGVGSAASIGYRQWLYLAFLALSILGMAVAVGVLRWRRRVAMGGAADYRPWLWSVGLYVIYASIVYALMPGNPDPVDMPGELVWSFRVVAFLGLVLFWAVLGWAFGWFLRDVAHPVPVGRRAE